MGRERPIAAAGTRFVGVIGRVERGRVGTADQEGWPRWFAAPGPSADGAESAVPKVLSGGFTLFDIRVRARTGVEDESGSGHGV